MEPTSVLSFARALLIIFFAKAFRKTKKLSLFDKQFSFSACIEKHFTCYSERLLYMADNINKIAILENYEVQKKV